MPLAPAAVRLLRMVRAARWGGTQGWCLTRFTGMHSSDNTAGRVVLVKQISSAAGPVPTADWSPVWAVVEDIGAAGWGCWCCCCGGLLHFLLEVWFSRHATCG
jgi:hypothetical protein